MPRRDRIADLIILLRNGRLHRAQDLADRLGVSLRTIYRDMDRLIAAGLPIEGTRGIGYRTTAAVTLPVLNLTMTELAALKHGLTLASADPRSDLAQAARSVLAMIDAGMPAVRPGQTDGQDSRLGTLQDPVTDAGRGLPHLPVLRAALKVRQKLRVICRDSGGALCERILRPLQLDYWGRIWTLTAWCETRDAFVLIRLDQIETATHLPQLFLDEPGKTLADYIATRAST